MSFNQFHVQFWDLGGLSKVRYDSHYLRKEWENYYPNTHAIIYVIDSSDEHRFGDAYAELKVALKVMKKLVRYA
jgi:GTPase SAR1 family protein